LKSAVALLSGPHSDISSKGFRDLPNSRFVDRLRIRRHEKCLTIRTALLKDGKACVPAGGGWVNDSEPEAEFQETVNKSKAMLKAVALAEPFAKTAA